MKVRGSTEQRLLWRPPLAGQRDPLFRLDGMHRVPSMTYHAQNLHPAGPTECAVRRGGGVPGELLDVAMALCVVRHLGRVILISLVDARNATSSPVCNPGELARKTAQQDSWRGLQIFLKTKCI